MVKPQYACVKRKQNSQRGTDDDPGGDLLIAITAWIQVVWIQVLDQRENLSVRQFSRVVGSVPAMMS
jgi:hypothetical protein